MQRALLAIIALTLAPVPVFAHDTGASFERQVGAYLVDIGYSEPDPVMGQSVVFDFGLEKDGEEASFTDAWIKIEDKDGVVLATGIHNATYGGAKLTYAFPESGSYIISVRYERADDALAEASFELPVTAGDSTSKFSFDAISAALGLLIGIGIGFLVALRRRSARNL